MKLFAILCCAILTASASAQSNWMSFRGMCDASAVEMLTDDLFVAGNDEDNVLRIYSRKSPGLPVQVMDFSGFFRLRNVGQEIDLEGSARLGDRIYWISSHGANAKGKLQPSRHRFFATQVITNQTGAALRPLGQLSATLLRDLLADPRLASFNLAAAARKPPKDAGALNIEGLVGTPDGQLLIGFRNPIPKGKALVVPLLNPDDVIHGKRAQFGGPLLLQLGGNGIRSITRAGDNYVIVAGPYQGQEASALYAWDGKSGEPKLTSAKLAANPEGIVVTSGADGKPLLLVLSDDGTRQVAGGECKKLRDPLLKSFRAYELPLNF